MNDREKVLAEFLLGRERSSSAHDHESATGLLYQVLDEVEGEATEPVAVGDHKLSYVSRKAESKNGTQAGSLPIKSRTDVR